jgi:hypothetical protein
LIRLAPAVRDQTNIVFGVGRSVDAASSAAVNARSRHRSALKRRRSGVKLGGGASSKGQVSTPAGPSWWQGVCHLEQHSKRPCVQNVRKDPTDRLGCLLTGSPLPTAEGVRQSRGKARVWVAPHSLPPTGNQQYPRGVNSEPIIMDTRSRTRSVYIFVFERRKTGFGLAIGDTLEIHSQRRRAPVRSTCEWHRSASHGDWTPLWICSLWLTLVKLMSNLSVLMDR